jgi:LacI family transcriptional regulator
MPRIALAMEFKWVLRHHYDVIHGVQCFADDAGDWTLDIGPFPEIRIAHGVEYDGIVGRISAPVLDHARRLNIPVVNVWQNSPVAKEAPCVFADEYKMAYTATEHLYARGLRRFVHVGAKGQKETGASTTGVTAFAKEVGCPVQRLRLDMYLEDNLKRCQRAVSAIENAQKDWQRPIGIVISGDDTISRTLVSELVSLGWSIPHDAAVVAMWVEELTSASISPSLTSLDANCEQIGYQAAELLSQLMDGSTPPVAPILIPPKALVVRQSSDVFAVREPRVAKALRFMADQSDSSVTIDEVASHAGLCSQSLNRLFNQHLGHSMIKELKRLRVEHLKRVLVESDDTLDAVCAQAGFGTRASMHRTFKELTGETPAEYRKRRNRAYRH